ncbi:hypothetical protein G7077_08400 [Sphingomonas piscis]|uniref:Uncharacterized protein n=1 Tax=Sphingomonas piscis TaxID=2714943 RepID=A0A6G7YQA1_9SPHN|nr:hypothetical protein [Sphingomonas piscis]QIK78914.1 hypothetical protein G7077_08400 [Sphingomonas piscis]
MRYFLDTEFNGFGGALLSLALVPDDGEELYLTLQCADTIEPWVERHVVPYLDTVPDALRNPPLTRAEAAKTVAHYLQADEAPYITADWPEDIALFCMLLITGPGQMVPVPPLRFEVLTLFGFSTAANSAVPHNALHDARALKDHVLTLLE